MTNGRVLRRSAMAVALALTAAALAPGRGPGADGAFATTRSEASLASARADTAPGLRDLAAGRGVRIGTALDMPELDTDTEWRTVAAHEASVVTPENWMKWELIHPERDRYDFERADRIVAFAQANDMTVRGHTLVWHQQNPAWLRNGTWTRAELIRVLRNHITAVVGRYRGDVAQWDVVNEALNDDGTLRDNLWLRVIGPRYIDLAFEFAHRADPRARLFYNDYLIEYGGPKTDAALALVRGLQRRGVPISGVGFQMHVYAPEVAPTRATIERSMRRFATAGLAVAITEADVALALPADDAARTAQAKVYRRIVGACLAVARCRTIVLWGLSDRYSWIPGWFPGRGEALPLDTNLQPKPAYHAIARALRDD